VLTIANGTDTDTFKPRSALGRQSEALEAMAAVLPHVPQAAAAATLPVERRGQRFDSYCLFVGRLEPRKAPDLLVRAVAASPELHCVIVGDGPMRRELEALAARLQVADRICFLGVRGRPEVAALCADAQLLVLPSVSEASPLVVTEAMACGTPVLATRLAGLPTLVEDWDTGFLVTPGDLGELTVALRFLMRDHELRGAMGERAHRRVHERYGWRTVASEYDRLYRSILPREPVEGDELVEVAA
jgi:glycosyltransferase involved in cell wall biosynthesis